MVRQEQAQKEKNSYLHLLTRLFQCCEMLPFFLESVGVWVGMGDCSSFSKFFQDSQDPCCSVTHLTFTLDLCRQLTIKEDLDQTCILLWAMSLELVSFIVQGKHDYVRSSISREKSWTEIPSLHPSPPDPRFCHFDLSHDRGLQTKTVIVVLCTCSQRTVASQKKISTFCQLLLFVKFCQEQNRIKNNKQTSSLAARLLFT